MDPLYVVVVVVVVVVLSGAGVESVAGAAFEEAPSPS